MVERARATGAVPTVITFDPHPRAVLHPESAPPLLQTFDQKIEAFGVLGIEQTIVVRFTKEFSTFAPRIFCVMWWLTGCTRKRFISARDSRLVTTGKATSNCCKRLGGELGFVAGEVPEVKLRGCRVSSSKIRQLLAGGQVNLARRMLGRPYGVEGRVERGSERGHKLGFPTANLHPHNRVIPRNGVYVTGTLIDGQWRRSVTNVGVRPTFGDATEPSVETFVMNWDGDLYGDVVRVRFLYRLRDERKFSSIEELKTQIMRDVDRADSYFERAGTKHMLAVI